MRIACRIHVNVALYKYRKEGREEGGGYSSPLVLSCPFAVRLAVLTASTSGAGWTINTDAKGTL